MGDEPDPGLKERFFFANLNRNALNARKRTFDEFLKMIPAPMSKKHSQQVALAKTQAFYLQYTTSGGQFNLNSVIKTKILSVYQKLSILCELIRGDTQNFMIFHIKFILGVVPRNFIGCFW